MPNIVVSPLHQVQLHAGSTALARFVVIAVCWPVQLEGHSNWAPVHRCACYLRAVVESVLVAAVRWQHSYQHSRSSIRIFMHMLLRLQ